MKTIKIPEWITNVPRQCDSDRLLERQWRLKAQRKHSGWGRAERLHWLDDKSEPGSWVKELSRRGVKV